MPNSAPSTESAPTSGKSIFKNPLFLLGGGAIVLFLMIKSSGNSSSGGTDGSTASAVSQALSEQSAANAAALSDAQATQDAALADARAGLDNALTQQQADNQNQLDANAGSLNDILNRYTEATIAGTTNSNDKQAAENTKLEDLIQSLKDAIAKLQGTAPAASGGTTPAPAPATTPPAVAPVPTDQEIRDWAQGLRPDNPDLAYSWGKAIVAALGRLPNSIDELTYWLKRLGLKS